MDRIEQLRKFIAAQPDEAFPRYALALELKGKGDAAAAAAELEELRGRAPKPQHGLQSPKMWEDRAGLFALQRPENEHWMFRAGVRGPDGELVPLLAMSQESGAQLVVQSADGITDLRLLARMLMQNLSNEQRVHVEEVEK